MIYYIHIQELTDVSYTQVQQDRECPGVGNLLSVVVFLVVIVQYKLFMMQYKSVDFRAVSASAVKVPAEFLLASHNHICQLLAECMVNVFKISVQLNFNINHMEA